MADRYSHKKGEPALSAEGLSVGYGIPLVKIAHAEAQTAPGNLIALLGRNGCGKTTLLRTIAGLHPPLEGCCRIFGDDPFRLSPRLRAQRIAFAPARREVDSALTVRNALQLARYPRLGWFTKADQSDQKAIEEALELTSTKRFEYRQIGTLSDGERQRIWVTMALAQQTPLLLLDEPTAFLDIPAKNELMALLRHLAHSTNRLIIVSTHDLQTALWLADQLWIVDRGELLIATPEEAAFRGWIARVFSTEHTLFSPEQMSFIPKYNPSAQAPSFLLKAPPTHTLTHLTLHALARRGWVEHRDTSNALRPTLTISIPDAEKTVWLINGVETIEDFNTLDNKLREMEVRTH